MMEKSTLILTRKIRLIVDLPTQEERKEVLSTLYKWRNICFRAANLIVSHLYVQGMVKEFLYLSEGVIHKLVDEKKDEAGILQRSRINTTYRVISDRFKGEIPTNILICLNNRLYSSFNKDYQGYLKGEASLKNFKRDMAFPFGAERKKFLFSVVSTSIQNLFRKRFYRQQKTIGTSSKW